MSYCMHFQNYIFIYFITQYIVISIAIQIPILHYVAIQIFGQYIAFVSGKTCLTSTPFEHPWMPIKKLHPPPVDLTSHRTKSSPRHSFSWAWPTISATMVAMGTLMVLYVWSAQYTLKMSAIIHKQSSICGMFVYLNSVSLKSHALLRCYACVCEDLTTPSQIKLNFLISQSVSIKASKFFVRVKHSDKHIRLLYLKTNTNMLFQMQKQKAELLTLVTKK